MFTFAIEAAIKEKILFTPVILENVPHKQALKSYEDSDIIIDQLFVPGGGKLTSEDLALGKVVV